MGLLLGCGTGTMEDTNTSSDTSTDTASVPVTIRWHESAAQDTADVSIAAASFDCEGNGITDLICQVYDGSGNFLVEGGPWTCTDGTGTVDDIPAGDNLTFVVFAESAESFIYHGMTSGVTVEVDETNDDVVVDVYPFVPTLSSPEDGDEPTPDAFVLQWEEVESADQYLVEVAEDNAFENRIINEITATVAYIPTSLAEYTQYYWRISAVDSFTNIGAPSDVRGFITTEASGCTYTLSPTTYDFTLDGGTQTFDITASSQDCVYLISPSVDWITITTPIPDANTGIAEATGSTTVEYTVEASNEATERTGTISVGAQIYTITQLGTECTYELDPATATFTSEVGEGQFQVTASADTCLWSATTSADWITITAGNSITGSGTVTYSVTANTTGAERDGTITVGEQTHTITQAATGSEVTCTYSISPQSAELSSESQTNTIQITASAEACEWTAATGADWIIIPTAGGTGSGPLSYTVSAHTGASQRTGTITVGQQTHTVAQNPPNGTDTTTDTTTETETNTETETDTSTATETATATETSTNTATDTATPILLH
jgi:hypothetical protein